MWKRLASPGCAMGFVLLIWFGPALFLEQKIGYRDASHFYLPLYEYLSERVRSGEFPLWNPLQLTGTPVVGDTTSAMFYPPRILFLLGMATESALAWYCLAHLFLAWGTASYAAREAGAAPCAARLAGMAYALSAPVVEMAHNPPFLVGAAWLPLAVSGLWQCWDGGSRRAVLVAVLGLSMPVLGGDPQTVYHAGLICAMFVIGRWIRGMGKRSGGLPQPVRLSWRQTPEKLHGIASRIAPVGLACVLAFACSSLQLLPALQWSAHSNRASEVPAGISRWFRSNATADRDFYPWHQAPPTDHHASYLYRFSVGPWNLLECFAPGVWGQTKPINTRLGRAIDGDEQYWTESVYVGLPVILIVVLLLVNGRMNRWAWLAMVAFVLSWGRYGMVAAVQTSGGWLGQRWLMDWNPAIGGGYWWLVTFLPGYGSFRYPAKWLPVVALGLAVAFGKALTEMDDRGWGRLRRICIAVSGFSGMMLLISIFPMWETLLQHVRPNPDYGPLQIAGALHDFRVAWLQVVVIGAVLLVLGKRWEWKSPRREPRWIPAMVVLLTMDFLFAGANWIITSPRLRETFVALPSSEHRLVRQNHLVDGVSVVRPVDSEESHAPWLVSHSPHRALEIDFNEQRSLFGQWNLLNRLSLLNAAPSISPAAHETFWSTMQRTVPDSQESALSWARGLAWLGGGYLIDFGTPVFLQSQEHDQPLMVTEPRWKKNLPPLPRVRWYEKWRFLSEAEGRDPRQVWEAALPSITTSPENVPLMIGSGWESEPQTRSEAPEATPALSTTMNWNLIAADAQSAEFNVNNDKSGWFYLHVYQDGHWRADITSLTDAASQERTPVPANLVGQAIYLTPGKWRIRWTYSPSWLLPALICTAMGWSGFAFVALVARKRRRS